MLHTRQAPGISAPLSTTLTVLLASAKMRHLLELLADTTCGVQPPSPEGNVHSIAISANAAFHPQPIAPSR